MRGAPLVVAWVVAASIATAVGFGAVALVDGGLRPASTSSTAPLSAAINDASGSGTPATHNPRATATPLPTIAGPQARPRPGTKKSPAAQPRRSGSAQGSASAGAAADPSPGSRATSRPAPAASPSILRSASSAGGSVTARCTGELVTLTAWSPAPGYRVDSVDRGPATSARVRFVSGSVGAEIRVECSDGVPQFESESSSDG